MYDIIIYNSGFVKIIKCVLDEFIHNRKDDYLYSKLIEIMYNINGNKTCSFFENNIVRDYNSGIIENNMVTKNLSVNDTRVLPYFKIAIYSWIMSKIVDIVNASKIKEYITFEEYIGDEFTDKYLPIISFNIPTDILCELNSVKIQCEEIFKHVLGYFGFQYEVKKELSLDSDLDRHIGFINVEIL
jgi:hypothetical protein